MILSPPTEPLEHLVMFRSCKHVSNIKFSKNLVLGEHYGQRHETSAWKQQLYWHNSLQSPKNNSKWFFLETTYRSAFIVSYCISVGADIETVHDNITLIFYARKRLLVPLNTAISRPAGDKTESILRTAHTTHSQCDVVF